MGSELNGAGWNSVVSPTLEPGNAINFPGKYRVTWTPSWSSRGSSSGWSGSELNGSTCEYEPSPRNPVDPTEGPQPHPADGSVVGSLTLNVHVFADPPTCTVGDFLFEVNEPIVPKVTLSNPNNAPMWVDVADSNISRSGFSRTDVSGAAGLAVPANSDLYIFPTVPSIGHSGEFVLTWTIQTNMGAETWTTLGTPRPPQRSWFEDPEERIVDSSANACEANGNKVVYLPFIKVFYGGLAAGARFGDKASYDACGENFDHVVGEDSNALINNSFVAGHAEVTPSGDVRGSSVQYALQANNIIGGFYSASQRSSDPKPLKGLTLSNNDIAHAYGGSFGRQSCIANYWREVEKLTAEPASPNLDLSWLQNNDRKLYEASPPDVLEIENGRAPDSLNLKATIYVDGDVYITDDIINNDANTPKWYNPSQIGYLSIIVRGDINIAPGVERIDALLVAYPKEDSGGNIVSGTIRTCWYAGIDASATHFNTCNKQLVINGALIAEKVLFGRVHSSVKQEMSYPADPRTSEAILQGQRIAAAGNFGGYQIAQVGSGVAVNIRIDCSRMTSDNYLGVDWGISGYPPTGYDVTIRGPGSWSVTDRVHGFIHQFRWLTNAPGPGLYTATVTAIGGGSASGSANCLPLVVIPPPPPPPTAGSAVNVRLDCSRLVSDNYLGVDWNISPGGAGRTGWRVTIQGPGYYVSDSTWPGSVGQARWITNAPGLGRYTVTVTPSGAGSYGVSNRGTWGMPCRRR